MSSENDKMYEFLKDIQLEGFTLILRDQLHITRLSHFDYVKPKDLEKVGMSKPAIRRLLDAVNKSKKNNLTPSRPPPPPPPPSNQIPFNVQKKTTENIILNSRFLSFRQKNNSSKLNSQLSSQSVSFIINPNDIEILKSNKGDNILGSGNFGVVKKAVWSTPNGSKITVAVKCLHENYIDANEQDRQQAFIDIFNEISCMCGLNHKNLIKLYGVVMNGSGNGNGMIMMVTELAMNGSLLKLLRKNRELKTIAIKQLYSYIYQIAEGMEYLENKKLIHRDLAARNILLYSNDHVKICDFGMTRNARNGVYTMTESHKIPCAWYPPESIREKLFSIKSDIWAFGVTMWEIFSFGEQPWPNMNANEILIKIDIENKRLSIPYLCSKNFYKIILECWSKEPSKRPSFNMLKNLIKTIKIIEMKAKNSFKEENKLELEQFDLITIIEGSADRYWWKGQNSRTLLTGSFPRTLLDPGRKINSDDISLPLKNSFIHTGHMGIGSHDKTWGNPGKIDEIFLKNPQNPPDFLAEINDEEEIKSENNKSNICNSSNSISNENFNDLIDLFGPSSEINITYPDYSQSINSLEFKESEDSSLKNNFNHSNYAQTNTNEKYILNNLSINEYNSYYNNVQSKSINEQAHYYYNNDFSSVDHQNYNHNYFNDFGNKINSFSSKSQLNQKQNDLLIKPSNPFNSSASLYQNLDEQNFQQSVYVNNNMNFSNSLAHDLDLDKKKIESNQFNIKFSNDKNLNVDDLLNKVMNDVMNDFKNVKVNK